MLAKFSAEPSTASDVDGTNNASCYRQESPISVHPSPVRAHSECPMAVGSTNATLVSNTDGRTRHRWKNDTSASSDLAREVNGGLPSAVRIWYSILRRRRLKGRPGNKQF